MIANVSVGLMMPVVDEMDIKDSVWYAVLNYNAIIFIISIYKTIQTITT